MTTDEINALNEATRAKADRSHERVKAAEKKAKRLTKAKAAELRARVADTTYAISHRVAWFTDEADADLMAARDNLFRIKFPAFATYNGGYMHGALCGREPHRDFTKSDGTTLYACTF